MKITRANVLALIATSTLIPDGVTINKGVTAFIHTIRRTTNIKPARRLYRDLTNEKGEVVVPAGTVFVPPNAKPIRRVNDKVGVVVGIYDRKTKMRYVGSSLTNIKAGDTFDMVVGVEMALNRAFAGEPGRSDAAIKGEMIANRRIDRMIAAETSGTAKKRRKRRVSGVSATTRAPKPPQIDPVTGLELPRRGPGRPRKNPLPAPAVDTTPTTV